MKGNKVNNEFNEDWTELGAGDEAYDKVIEYIDYKKDRDPGIMYVAEVAATENYEKFYVAQIHGGCNGHGNWIDYLDQIKTILSKFKKVWVIDLVNDCLDDVWDLRFGFEL